MGRRRLKVHHGDQRTLAVDGSIERQAGRIAQVVIEIILDALLDGVHLVVEINTGREDGVDEILDVGDEYRSPSAW